MRRPQRHASAPRPAFVPTFTVVPSRPTRQVPLSRFRPRVAEITDAEQAKQVVRAHALKWAFGGARLDSHGFNLRHFPHLGVTQSRKIYTWARALEEVRWPA